HYGTDLLTNTTQLVGIFTQYAERQRPHHGRAVQKPPDTDTRLRESSIVHLASQRGHYPVAGCWIFSYRHHLGEGRIRLFRVGRDKEPGGTSTDISGHIADTLHAGQKRLDFARCT